MKKLGKMIIAVAACSLLSMAPESKAQVITNGDMMTVWEGESAIQNLQQPMQLEQQEVTNYGVAKPLSDAKKLKGVKGRIMGVSSWNEDTWLATADGSKAYLYILRDDVVQKTINLSGILKEKTGVKATYWYISVYQDNSTGEETRMRVYLYGWNEKKGSTITLYFDETGKCVATADIEKSSTTSNNSKTQYKKKWYITNSKSYKAKKAGQTITLKVASKKNGKYKTVKTNVKALSKGDTYYVSAHEDDMYGMVLTIKTPKNKYYAYYSKDGKNFKKIKLLQGIKTWIRTIDKENCKHVVQNDKKIGFYIVKKPNKYTQKLEYKVKKKSRAGVYYMGSINIVSTGAKNYVVEMMEDKKEIKQWGTTSLNATDILSWPSMSWTDSNPYETASSYVLCKNGKLYALNGFKNMTKYTLPIKCKSGTMVKNYGDGKLYISLSKYANGKNATTYVMEEKE